MSKKIESVNVLEDETKRVTWYIETLKKYSDFRITKTVKGKVFVKIGSKKIGSGASLREAIDDAMGKMEPDDNESDQS